MEAKIDLSSYLVSQESINKEIKELRERSVITLEELEMIIKKYTLI